MSWVEFHQDHVAFFIVHRTTLVVCRLLHPFGCFVQVGFGSVKLLIPSLVKMVGTQTLSLKSSQQRMWSLVLLVCRQLKWCALNGLAPL